ncbi:MAG: hypothetical protein A2934_01905 [Candidatus Sungbacteria bacterium RIFCSPLOWO2_01_FULL_47_10]|uniref:Glycosyltransferase RgtA/B/C/D-like domain-containing protein n=1 Tax=Candidatus Sungbacteria bacterium RIFCSPLOWO2_01_FULL_47_10 TaxID=1802276 RepID=A0A1G2L2K3_9BACT|nr:MAG: hypothetical protein A2934_01905 [Candidatus Sungbacteria bacterium RIFCSPLOWO2_01_FULL_47_10]
MAEIKFMIIHMKEILKRHWQILSLSIVIGLLFIYPHIYLRTFDSAHFMGVDVLGSDAESHYVARIQEVYDGHQALGQTFLWEGKDLPYLGPPFEEAAVAYMGKALWMNSVQVNIFAKFLFGLLLSLVIYFFVLELFSDRLLALSATAFILLGSVLTSLPDIRSLLSPEVKNFEFLRYARPINPLISSLVMFGYLLAFLRHQRSRSKTYFAASGILLGLSFYAYVYIWTYLLVMNGLLLLWYAARKNLTLCRDTALITALSLVIALPYLMSAYSMSHHPFYQGVFERQGFFRTHMPILSKFGLLGLLAIVFSFLKKSPAITAYGVIAFVASLVAINHQVLTGINIQNDHYHWYVVTPLASVFILTSLYFYVGKISGMKAQKALSTFLIAVFLFTGFFVQYRSYGAMRDETLRNQRLAPVLDWLKKNVPAESVIFSSRLFSDLIPVYTPFNVYYSSYAPYYLISDERLLTGYFLQVLFEGVSEKDAREYFMSHKDSVAANLFMLKYRYTNGCSACFPDTLLTELTEKYKNFLNEGVQIRTRKYRLDYIVWDKETNPGWKFMDREVQQLFVSGDIVVLKVF